jgi:hypothetical protein
LALMLPDQPPNVTVSPGQTVKFVASLLAGLPAMWQVSGLDDGSLIIGPRERSSSAADPDE